MTERNSSPTSERMWSVAEILSRAIGCAPTWAGIVTMLAVGLVLGISTDMSALLTLDAVLWAVSGFLIVSGFGTIWMLRKKKQRHETLFLTIGVGMLGGAIMGRVYVNESPFWVMMHLVSASMLVWYLFMTVYMHMRKHYED
jgi:hypothetical protein